MDKKKRAEELFSAITDIDDKYIEEAEMSVNEGENMVTVRPGKKRWVAVAACFLILVTALIPLGSNLLNKATVKENNFTDEASIDGNAPYEAYNSKSTVAPKVTANVVDSDFSKDKAWVKVSWSNPTDEDIEISSKFIIVRVLDDNSLESVISGDTVVVFDDVKYKVPKNEEYTLEYNIDKGIYNIEKAGHYRIYFDISEVPEDTFSGYYFDFEIS